MELLAGRDKADCCLLLSENGGVTVCDYLEEICNKLHYENDLTLNLTKDKRNAYVILERLVAKSSVVILALLLLLVLLLICNNKAFLCHFISFLRKNINSIFIMMPTS